MPNDNVFVGGYLVIYDSQEDAGDEYRLAREVAVSALPVEPGRVPVNINHDANCKVGVTIAICDVGKGLFFLGAVSGALSPILFRYVDGDLFSVDADGRGAALSETEKFLYLLSNVLPSLSLSSSRLSEGELPDKNFFSHIALCELGKRDGTVAIYGSTPSEVIDAFSGLGGNAKRDLLLEIDKFSAAKIPPVIVDDAAVTNSLLKKFVNNAFLMDRGDYLRARRAIADIDHPKYLQAAETVRLMVDGGRLEAATICKEKSNCNKSTNYFANQPNTGTIKVAEENNLTNSCTEMNSTHATGTHISSDTTRTNQVAQAAAAMQHHDGVNSPCAGEMIYVPLEKYNSLVISASQGARHPTPNVHAAERGQFSYPMRTQQSSWIPCESTDGRRTAEQYFTQPFYTNPGLHYYGHGYDGPLTARASHHTLLPFPSSVPLAPQYYGQTGLPVVNFLLPNGYPPQSHIPFGSQPQLPQFSSTSGQEAASTRNLSHLDARLDALLSALEKERANVNSMSRENDDVVAQRRRKLKRQLSSDSEAPEQPYFPGEVTPPKKSSKRTRMADGEDAGHFSDLIQGLAALHKDVTEMKASVSTQIPAQTPQNKNVSSPTESSQVQETAPIAPAKSTVDASSSKKLKEARRVADKKRAADEFAKIMSTE